MIEVWEWIDDYVGYYQISNTGMGLDVCHINGINTDNSLPNLRYGTKRSNALDSVKHGTNHNANKIKCSQGHLLDGKNLAFRGIKRKRRVCVA